MLETLDYTIRFGNTPTILYFDIHLYSAYVEGPMLETLDYILSVLAVHRPFYISIYIYIRTYVYYMYIYVCIRMYMYVCILFTIGYTAGYFREMRLGIIWAS